MSGSGYGQIKCFGKMVSTHRLSYELYNGSIPNGLEVMHLCDNKICINPDHLKVGTHSENMKSAHENGLINYSKKKHSPKKGLESKQSIQVEVLGKVYESINMAEKSLGLGKGTVRWWIKNKPEKAKTITREEYLNAK